jgi:hypothetical protein
MEAEAVQTEPTEEDRGVVVTGRRFHSGPIPSDDKLPSCSFCKQFWIDHEIYGTAWDGCPFIPCWSCRGGGLVKDGSRFCSDCGGKGGPRYAARGGEDLRVWFEELGRQEQKIVVTVNRHSPKYYNGVLTAGFLATYDEPVYEDTIREQHGGGKFQLVLKKKAPDGKWKYFTTRTVEIPGDPRIDNLSPEGVLT